MTIGCKFGPRKVGRKEPCWQIISFKHILENYICFHLITNPPKVTIVPGGRVCEFPPVEVSRGQPRWAEVSRGQPIITKATEVVLKEEVELKGEVVLKKKSY